MTNIEIVPLSPKHADTDPMVDAVRVDMERSYYRARAESGPFGPAVEAQIQEALDSVSHERTLRRVENNPGQYFVARALDQDLAYARFNRWGLIDQAPYEAQPRRGLLTVLSKAHALNTLNAPLGIFSLFGTPERHDETDAAIDALTKKAIEIADGKEIRVGVSSGDPIEAILDQNFFEPTDKVAEGMIHVPALRQRLFVRTKDIS